MRAMGARNVAALVLAGVVAVAAPAWSQSRGGARGGGGRPAGGGHFGSGGHLGSGGRVGSGSHVGSGGWVGFGTHGGSGVRRGLTGHPNGGLQGGVPHWGGGGHAWRGRPGWRGSDGWHGSYGWRGSYGWGGWYGWPGLYLGLPYMWNGGWGWPYDGWWNGPYGAVGPYEPEAIDVAPSGSDEPSGSAGAAARVAAPTAGPGQDTAALRLRVSPGNAAVYIDGVFTGSGAELARLQRGVAVAPGDHRIDVVAPGHSGKSVEVEVAAGQVQDVVLGLE